MKFDDIVSKMYDMTSTIIARCRHQRVLSLGIQPPPCDGGGAMGVGSDLREMTLWSVRRRSRTTGVKRPSPPALDGFSVVVFLLIIDRVTVIFIQQSVP